MKSVKPPARPFKLDPIKHYDWIAIVASSWFPFPSRAFLLDIIEESYNMNPPLIFYPNKFGFRSMCCLFSLIFFWVGPQVWAIAPWIRVCLLRRFMLISDSAILDRPQLLCKSLILVPGTGSQLCEANALGDLKPIRSFDPIRVHKGEFMYNGKNPKENP